MQQPKPAAGCTVLYRPIERTVIAQMGPAMGKSGSRVAPDVAMLSTPSSSRIIDMMLNLQKRSFRQRIMDAFTGFSRRTRLTMMRVMRENENRHEGEMWLLREKVYALSSELGRLGTEARLDEMQQFLHSWAHEENGVKKEKLAKHIETLYMRDCVLVVTDMSGFTRITREEGVLHFLMLIKQMQSICVPIFERYGGHVVKIEADDLFVVFSGHDAELAVRATLLCMQMTDRFSAGKRKNDRVKLAAGIIAGPAWVIHGVDVFGGITQ